MRFLLLILINKFGLEIVYFGVENLYCDVIWSINLGIIRLIRG